MRKILFALLLTGMIQPAFALSDARLKLNKFFTQVTSMKGSFIQQVYSKKGNVQQTARGQLYLVRPGKFRWIYSQPDPQEIIADGKNVWIYDKELDQVTVKPITQAMAGTPATILMQKKIPDSQFKVLEMDDRTSGWNWFYLTPHRKSADFRAIQLGLDQAGNVKQMVLYDHIGQKTVITLNVKNNIPVNGQRFVFRPPEGVDVIGKPQ